MKRRPWMGFCALVLTVIVTAGCEPGTPTDSTSTSPAPTKSVSPPPPLAKKKTEDGRERVIGFTGHVNVREADPTCKTEKCWLPTQFQRSLVANETVSTRDAWPLQDEAVWVFCEGDGERVKDLAGRSSKRWYGVFIPQEQLDEEAVDRAKPITAQGRRGLKGYVSELWVTGGEKVAAENCNGFK